MYVPSFFLWLKKNPTVYGHHVFLTHLLVAGPYDLAIVDSAVVNHVVGVSLWCDDSESSG